MSAFAPTSLADTVPTTLVNEASLGALRRRPTAEAPFADALEQAKHREDETREAADQLVATAFVLPLLQQVRDDPFKSDLFHGGQGEEIFGQQLDVLMAERITKSAGFGLSDALVRQFNPATASREVDLRG